MTALYMLNISSLLKSNISTNLSLCIESVFDSWQRIRIAKITLRPRPKTRHHVLLRSACGIHLPDWKSTSTLLENSQYHKKKERKRHILFCETTHFSETACFWAHWIYSLVIRMSKRSNEVKYSCLLLFFFSVTW